MRIIRRAVCDARWMIDDIDPDVKRTAHWFVTNLTWGAIAFGGFIGLIKAFPV